tara:strand:- start:2183 stop:2770 length:588 start_codon:yes stop_codon:yes gene_type:complete
MRAKEFIMEVPTSGTTGTTGTTNTAVGTGTPAPAPTSKYGRPQGGRGNPVSKVRNDDGTMTSSDQITGNTKNSGAMGTTTTNRAGQTIEKQTPRFMGIQQTTNIDPATGKETTSTNYRGKVDGARVNVTTPGTMDQFDLKKATQQQVTSGGVTATKTQGGPTTLQMNFGPNQVNMTKTGNKQPTTTFKRSGKVVK